jgi:hypothetical protein
MKDLSWRYRAVLAAYQLAFVLLVSGVLVALLGRRVGAYLAISGITATLAVHLGLGIAGYREVMNRPWPEVAPLDDEDDW